MTPVRPLLIAAFMFATYAAHAAEDKCNDVLANGVWNFDLSDTDVHNVSAFINWYKSTTSSTTSVDKKQSLSGSLVYDGAPLSLGLSNDNAQNQQFLQQLDTLNAGYDQYDLSVVKFVKSASAVIINAWSNCMNAKAPGMHASLKFTNNPVELLVYLGFSPIDQTPKAAVKFGPGAGLSCDIPRNHVVTVPSNVSTVVRCTRSNGSAGSLVLGSNTLITPDNSLNYSSIRFPKTGPYGTCAVVEEIKNGSVSYGPATAVESGEEDIGNGASSHRHLEVPVGFKLGDVQKHCQNLPGGGDNPCAFVNPTAEAPWSWTIPDRSMDWNPQANSGRVGVWITGSKSQIFPGFTRQSNGTLTLSYGKSFSVEFPATALDVVLECQAAGNSRIYSLSDLRTKGEQIYLNDERQGATGKIFDMAVEPFDVDQSQEADTAN